jgi:DNA-binding transcriptional MerR regulator
MKIQELERKTGLERPSIRFYEKEGLLNPKRLENGYRDYSDEDVELLKKIKLLRRLGMSVEKIRNLQQGSEDLSQAIALLTAHHSTQIEEHKRCRAVCEAMHSDGAEFETLDAEHYLKLLREIQINEKPLGRTDFQENMPREIHPWRRFFARWLDYGLWSAVISFLYIVVLRVRPLPGDFLSALITIAGMALFIPAEALMLWKLGTTPGKFALGIRLESIQGGNLTWEEALRRSCNVFVLGNGCCIPLLEPVMKVMRYCENTGRIFRGYILDGPQEMPWDEETEIVYRDVNVKRAAVIALMLVLMLSIGIFSGFDGIRPKYRGNELTIREFSENYNACLKLFAEDHQSYERLQQDGTWKPVPQNTAIMDFNDDRSNHRMEFEYQLEGECIRSISIEHDWNNVSYLYPLTGEPLYLVRSVLLAQKGCGFGELMELTNLYWQQAACKTAAFDYKNLTIEWKISSELPMEGCTIFNPDDKPAEAQLFFKITIH